MNLMKLKGEIKMGALSEQELAAFSADFNKNDKNKVASRAARRNGLFEASLMMKFQNG